MNNTDRYVEPQIQEREKVNVMGSTHSSLKRIKLWKNVNNPVILQQSRHIWCCKAWSKLLF